MMIAGARESPKILRLSVFVLVSVSASTDRRHRHNQTPFSEPPTPHCPAGDGFKAKDRCLSRGRGQHRCPLLLLLLSLLALALAGPPEKLASSECYSWRGHRFMVDLDLPRGPRPGG